MDAVAVAAATGVGCSGIHGQPASGHFRFLLVAAVGVTMLDAADAARDFSTVLLPKYGEDDDDDGTGVDLSLIWAACTRYVPLLLLM